MAGSWSRRLPTWYAEHGRHHLAWRETTNPWAVLVSEVMLQQTSVARVALRWPRFLERWPTPASCAAAPLADVLREWDGLGYPRRARALWRTAATVAQAGWPDSEDGLRALPGVGPYTARAMLSFSTLGDGRARVPRDVNISRVAARAALGAEAPEVTAAQLDAALAGGRPRSMDPRHFAYALFDVGAAHCRSRPRCLDCPLAPECRARGRHGASATPPRSHRPYVGSIRELRGAMLRQFLASDPPRSRSELLASISDRHGAAPGACQVALEGLIADGLVPAVPESRLSCG